MKVIIAGGRDIEDYNLLLEAVDQSDFNITEVVCGMAKGVDLMGMRWAEENGIPVKEFPANWSKFHRAAGPIRNDQMAKYAEALIAIMKPGSKGTANMVKLAHKNRLRVFVLNVEPCRDK
jgi:hypothetical protein